MEALFTPLGHSGASKRLRFTQAVGYAVIGLLASASYSQAAEYVWTGAAGDGIWETAANWAGNAVPPNGNQIVINGNYSVKQTGSLNLTSALTPATNPVYGFILAGGATYDNRSGQDTFDGANPGSSFRIAGMPSVTNNALIDTGSTLLTDRFWLGNNPKADVTPQANRSNKVSTTTIKGTVIAVRDFVGYRPQWSEATEGGYILHLDGGSFITPVFSFGYSGSMGNSNLTAHVLISNGGYLDMGNVAANWTDSAVQYIDFLDTTGTLVFNKTGAWSNTSGVQALIDEGYIRASGGGNFNIVDNGSSWLISIPEPSTYALLIGGALLGLVLARRRLRR